MKKAYSVEEYIENNAHFDKALHLLRSILNSTELIETLKWNAPVYTINDKNVVGLGAFKNHFGIWFFNGVFLIDKQKLLINAQEGKTKALRQMRFTKIDEIDKSEILSYVKEAIENQKLGKEIKPDRKKKELIIPEELKVLLNSDRKLEFNFNELTAYKQREYTDYISDAKRNTTKVSRLEKIKPMILQNMGLHDKYKNC